MGLLNDLLLDVTYLHSHYTLCFYKSPGNCKNKVICRKATTNINKCVEAALVKKDKKIYQYLSDIMFQDSFNNH